MPNKCVAVGCHAKRNENVTYHRFPLQNKELLSLWLKHVNRKDFIPTKHSVLCSYHFSESDFSTTTKDTNNYRKQRRSRTLKKRCLKEGSVPSKFPNLPRYLSTEVPKPRSGMATSSKRHERDVLAMETRSEDFIGSDKISCYDDLLSNIYKETTPSGFVIFENDSGINMAIMSKTLPFTVIASLTVDKCMNVLVYHKEKSIPHSSYYHIMQKQSKISMISQVLNLMAFVKSLDDQPSIMDHKGAAIECLNSHLDSGIEDDAENMRIAFLKEQLELSCHSKFGRRYT